MNSGKTIFSQLMDFLPIYESFGTRVERYHGNYKIKTFSCLDQFLCMAFAQLTYRESLRDIEACLTGHANRNSIIWASAEKSHAIRWLTPTNPAIGVSMPTSPKS